MYDWKEYKGLMIPKIPIDSTYMIREDGRCIVHPTGNTMSTDDSCFGLDCRACIYCKENLKVSINYLVSVNLISKEIALKLMLDAED